MSIGRKVQKVLSCIAVVLFAAMVLYFLLLAGFSTTHITNDASEKSMLVADSVWINALVALGFCAVSFLLFMRVPFFKRFLDRMNADPAFAKKVRLVLIILYFVICLVFILCARQGADSDQGEVCASAQEWHWHEFSSLEEGGYVHRYPNQIGIITIFYVLSGIFGNCNYIAFQFLNVLMLCLAVWKVGKIADLCGRGGATGFFWMLGLVLFLPLMMYNTFVYGTIFGLCFCVLAVEEAVKSLSTDPSTPPSTTSSAPLRMTGEGASAPVGMTKEKKAGNLRRWIHFVLCIVFALLAVWCKQNYLIMVIALGLAALVYWRAKWLHLLCLFAAMALVAVGSMPLISAVGTAVTGKEMPKGIVQLAWVEMGLQENPALYNGWWNGYNVSSFEEAEYDQEEQRKIVEKDLNETLVKFNDLDYAMRFFAGKNASQWNNPDFQAWWINQVYPALSTQPMWMKAFLTPVAQDRWAGILNYGQFICLFGCLLYVFFKKDKDFFCLWCMICYIGGMLFHSVWEAKPQYTLVYWVLLIPAAVSGFGALLRKVDRLLRKKKLGKEGKGLLAFACAMLVLFGAVQLTCKETKVGALFIENDGTERYQEYIQSHLNDPLDDDY